jgi:hypothetical protein
MRTVSGRWRVWLAAAFVVTASAGPALGVPWRQVARGLSLFDTQIGLERNLLGDGWDLRLASDWQAQTYNFGLSNLSLNGQMITDLHLTTRGLPQVEFSTVTPQAVQYVYEMNTGVQDVVLSGSFTVNGGGSVNAFGFYDLDLTISNRGDLESDGFVLAGDNITDFDIGPINVSGNVFVDAIAAIVDPFFAAANVENPFAKISGRATKSIEFARMEDQIRAKIVAGELLSEEELDTLIGATVTSRAFGGLLDNSAELESLLDEALSAYDAAGSSPESGSTLSFGTPTPEPAGVLLAGMGLSLWVRRRRGR